MSAVMGQLGRASPFPARRRSRSCLARPPGLTGRVERLSKRQLRAPANQLAGHCHGRWQSGAHRMPAPEHQRRHACYAADFRQTGSRRVSSNALPPRAMTIRVGYAAPAIRSKRRPRGSCCVMQCIPTSAEDLMFGHSHDAPRWNEPSHVSCAGPSGRIVDVTTITSLAM